LTPGGQFGLHMTLGLALMVVSVVLFGHIADEVMDQDAITVLDLQIANWFNANHVEPYTSFMLFISFVHKVGGMIVLVAAFGYYLWRRQQRYWLLALGVTNDHALVPEGVLQGLKIVAVAVVAHAVYGMARQHCTTLSKIALALIAASVVLLVPLAWTQIAVIAVAGLVGMLLFRPGLPLNADHLPTPISLEAGAGWLIAFVSLLLGLPLLSTLFPSQTLALIESFYRVGSLVFGGGHCFCGSFRQRYR
jgi:chromate transport protein ChrA